MSGYERREEDVLRWKEKKGFFWAAVLRILLIYGAFIIYKVGASAPLGVGE